MEKPRPAKLDHLGCQPRWTNSKPQQQSWTIWGERRVVTGILYQFDLGIARLGVDDGGRTSFSYPEMTLLSMCP